jgi:hypothetical protein
MDALVPVTQLPPGALITAEMGRGDQGGLRLRLEGLRHLVRRPRRQPTAGACRHRRRLSIQPRR